MGEFSKAWTLLAGVSAMVPFASPAWADEQQNPTGSAAESRSGEIVVQGERQRDIFAGLVAETEFDENDIAAYGFDSVGELLEQVFGEVDRTGEGPVVLINGKLANGINDIADLPSEAVSRIQVLPRQAGARLGQSLTRRVINIVIKPNLRQITGSATGVATTRGDAYGGEGELNILQLQDGNRASLVLKAKHGDPLYESDRNIVTDTSGTPFDLAGNVLSFPSTGFEIDPALSARAGAVTTVAGVPVGIARPILSDFARTANRANTSDLGRFRTLAGESESYSANGNLTRRFDGNTTLALNARIERSVFYSLTGAATTLFRVPGMSQFSPFGRDVGVARAFGDPLRQNQHTTTINLNQTLNTQLGKFGLTITASLAHRVGNTLSDRDYDVSTLQAAYIAGTQNPFAAIDPGALGVVRSDRARARSDNGIVQAIATGSLFKLPAGDVSATLRVGARVDRFSSSTVSRTFAVSRFLKRDEEEAQLNVQLPLVADDSAVGGLTLDVTGGLRKVKTAGTLHSYGAGLSWNPADRLNLRATTNVEEIAPTPGALTDPIVVIDNFRTFDFVRLETVLVRYVTGGNPDLPVQRRSSTVFGGTFEPFRRIDLKLNVEYEHEVGRNVLSALPPADARVQLAFPDRYLRDARGVLVQLDARPVTYSRDLSEQVRWALDFKRVFGGTVAGGGTSGGEGADAPVFTPGSGWRVNLNLSHTWFLENTRLARRGLPVIDLLAGGAQGYGGGQPQHVVQFTGGLYRQGFGLQLNGSWRDETRIRAGTIASPDDVVFASRTLINARLFANLGPQFPRSTFAKGARIAFGIGNLLDSKQRVTDGTGATPLRYQPFLLDPLGRTISISLRKVF